MVWLSGSKYFQLCNDDRNINKAESLADWLFFEVVILYVKKLNADALTGYLKVPSGIIEVAFGAASSLKLCGRSEKILKPWDMQYNLRIFHLSIMIYWSMDR